MFEPSVGNVFSHSGILGAIEFTNKQGCVFDAEDQTVAAMYVAQNELNLDMTARLMTAHLMICASP
jgi:hypothetical protein